MKYAEGDSLYRPTVEVGAETLSPDHPPLAKRLDHLAGFGGYGFFTYIRHHQHDVYSIRSVISQGKYEEAESLYRRSVAIEENAYGRHHPEIAVALNNWASLLEKQVRAVKFFARRCWKRR